jgi:hypothetical protein
MGELSLKEAINSPIPEYGAVYCFFCDVVTSSDNVSGDLRNKRNRRHDDCGTGMIAQDHGPAINGAISSYQTSPMYTYNKGKGRPIFASYQALVVLITSNTMRIWTK